MSTSSPWLFPYKMGVGEGARKGLFPSFSLSEGKGSGDEVEHMSLREKCKQRFVYLGKRGRRQPRPKGKPQGREGCQERNGTRRKLSLFFLSFYFGAPLMLRAPQWLFAIIPNSAHFVLLSPTPRFQMRFFLSALGKPVTETGKSLAKRRIYRLLNEF